MAKRLKIMFLASLLCMLAAMTFFPLLSSSNGTLASVTVALPNEAYGLGIHPDRDFDLSTGSRYWDVPIWVFDSSLFLLSAGFCGAWLWSGRTDATCGLKRL
jgi:hypothetical protein